MSIHDRIAAASDTLTPTDRRIAAAILDDPTLLAFGTVSDLAARVETSRPSIVRFATRLGFEGYTELQGWARAQVSRQLASPSHRIRQPHDAGDHRRAAVEDAVAQTFGALDEEQLPSLAAPLLAGHHVWILSGETSMAGAHTLASGLSMLRDDVRLVDEHALGRELTGAGPADTAVVFDFARYRRTSVTAARTLADIGVHIVAITDGPLSPLAGLTPTWCSLRIPAVGPFDSAVPAVLAAELLVARVAQELGERATERIDRLEALWQATGTFLNYTPRRAHEI